MPPKKRTAEAADLDPSKLSVAQLKEELKKRGCAYTGNKAQLVSRLEDALNGELERSWSLQGILTVCLGAEVEDQSQGYNGCSISMRLGPASN